MSGGENGSIKSAHSWQSFAVTLVAAVVSFATLPPMPAMFSALLATLCVFIAWVDLERLIIPDLANAAIAVLGLALTVIEMPPGAWLESISDALMRSIVAGGLLLVVRFAFERLAGKEGLGLGDVKLMAAGAIFLSWATLPYALVLATAAAILAIALRSIRHGGGVDRGMQIPFGAFLAPAIWVAFLLERLDLL